MANEAKSTRESYDYTEDLKQARNELASEHAALLEKEMKEIKSDLDTFLKTYTRNEYNGCWASKVSFHKKALDILSGIYGVMFITCVSNIAGKYTITFGPKISDEIAKHEGAIERLKKKQRV
jgi:hypothetical protein